MNLLDRLSHAWNAFQNKDPTYISMGPSSFTRPDRTVISTGRDRTIISSIYNKIAVDVCAIDIKHIKVDDNEYFVDMMENSSLNHIFSVEANIDQTSREFMRDVVISMFDEGYVAIVPVDTDKKPGITGAFEINTVRTGRITQWYPEDIEVEVYNEKSGRKEMVVMKKRSVAIIENPFYSVMNEPNSTLKRVVRKLELLDKQNERSNSGKLDMIIQLPYLVKSATRKQQAEQRKKDLEDQLTNSKYGIAYTDGTEKIVQLGHPMENNLLQQIEYEIKLLYNQLGLTENVFNGTANEEEMLNYYNRTIEPIISAITEEMQRKFLTKTARSQNQRITFFRDPFKLIAPAQLVELADSLSRNEIMTSNELRAQLGLKPFNDPRADELINKNINPAEAGDLYPSEEDMMYVPDDETFAQNQNREIAYIDDRLNQLDSMAQSALAHTGENKPAGGYASKYYDPDKAHEYYERTKRLKGRRSTAGLNEKGLEAATYVMNRIDTEHASELEKAKQKNIGEKESLKQYGQYSTEEIKEALSSALDEVRNATKSELEGKRNKLKATIENSTESTKRSVEQLYEQMQKTTNQAARRGFKNQIEQLREANNASKDALTQEFAEDVSKSQESYSSVAEGLTGQASEAIDRVKTQVAEGKIKSDEEFQKTKKELEEKYGQMIEDEMNKIREQSGFQKEKKTKKSSKTDTGFESKYIVGKPRSRK